MKIVRQCETCEFNANHKCIGYGNQFTNGEMITDNRDIESECTGWGASVEYFSELVETAPWYIKMLYDDCSIDYSSFLKKIDFDNVGEPVSVNIYDAIQKIYGISLVELAELLGVTTNVVLYARSRGTVAKRVTHFSQVLCIPVRYFNQFSSLDFKVLEACKEDFFSNGNPLEHRETKAKWKEEKLIPRISDCLSCNHQFARKFYTISSLVWNNGDDINGFRDVEQDLIRYIRILKSELGCVVSNIDYKIDGRGFPKLSYSMLRIK